MHQKSKYYRMAQHDFTPEMELFCLLLDRFSTENGLLTRKQHTEYLNKMGAWQKLRLRLATAGDPTTATKRTPRNEESFCGVRSHLAWSHAFEGARWNGKWKGRTQRGCQRLTRETN